MKPKLWWKAHSTLIGRLVSHVGSVASLVALLLFFSPPVAELRWWHFLLLIAALVFTLFLLLLEVRSSRDRHIFAAGDKNGIRQYMHKLIEEGERVAVWTRDMSWARNSDTTELLKKKARQKELIICLPNTDSFVDELQAGGAEVCAYAEREMSGPTSRFTVTHFGRDGARVAVGRAEGEYHVIEEFGKGGHPSYYLAEDLVALARNRTTTRAKG